MAKTNNDVTDLVEARPPQSPPEPTSPAERYQESAGDTEPGKALLNPAHEVFAQAVAVHGNQSAAYQEAFPNAAVTTAKVEGCKLAKRVKVAERVHELVEARRAKLLADSQHLEAMVANLCAGKPAALVDSEGRPIPFHKLPTDVQRAIKSVKLRVSHDADGNAVSEYELQFPDPLAALRLLAQLRGALIERHDLTSAGKPVRAPLLSPEQHTRVLDKLLGENTVGDLV
jgi:Terminase small subunit